MIACILCGGIGETMLVMAGCSAVIGWFKKRHNKRKCKCCQEQEHKDKSIETEAKK